MTTVRTIKLKRNPQPSDTVPDDIPDTMPVQETSKASAESPAATNAEPVETHPVSRASSKSYTAFVILALLAAIGIMAIIGLQYSELSFYKAEPSVWLKK